MKEQASNLSRPTNRHRAKSRLITKIFLVAVFVSGLASGALAQTKPVRSMTKLGRFLSTFYYVVNENSYPATQDSEIKNLAGQVLAKVNRQFRRDMDIEGTGILRDGRTVNFAGRNGSEILYRLTPKRWGWGIGQCPLKPYRSIAVDPALIPLGTEVYIPQLEGMKLPDGSIHDGVFFAEDIGGAIKNKHVDFFAQEGIESTLPFEGAGVHSGSYVEIYKLRDGAPDGCHTLPPIEGLEKSPIGARMDVLMDLANHYIARGARAQAHEVMRRMYELRAPWEKAGKPAGHPRLKRMMAEQEKIEVQEDVLASKYAGEVNGETLPQNEVILTFDDGPHETYTPKVRDILAENGMHAAFFEVGEMVAPHPELTQLVARSGHVLGNHSYTHPQLTKLSDEKVKEQIISTQKAIQTAMGGPGGFNDYFQLFFARYFNAPKKVTAPQFVRSPYGARSERTMKFINSTGMLHVMWNVDSLDWKDPSPARIEARVFKQLAMEGNRGIILFHDIHPQTVEAIKSILPRLKREGFRAVSLYEIH